MKTIKGIKNFLKNVWKFRHNLWDYKWWDYEFTLDLLYTSISIMEEEFRTKGIREKEALSSQVIQMNRVKTILENIKQSNYLDMAKAELGMDFIDNCWTFNESTLSPNAREVVNNLINEQQEHNSKIFAKSWELENAEWTELWSIIKGNGEDGTDLRGWWD